MLCSCVSLKRAYSLVFFLLILLSLFFLNPASTHAACDPVAADGVTATCTGDTLNQNDPTGYGDSSFLNPILNNVTVNVLSGASVTGTDDGILLNQNITINNAGIITGLNYNGVVADTFQNITNNGTITGGDNGVYAASTIVNLTNYDTITGDDDGVDSDGTIQSLTNHGKITGGDDGIDAEGNITDLTNFGTITGVTDDGIFSDRNINNLTNSGNITGDEDGIDARRNINNLTNSGKITGGEDGIYAQRNINNLTNSGTISGGIDGIHTNRNIANLTNSGNITGGTEDGIYANRDITNLTNSGTITGGSTGVAAYTLTSLTNSGTIIGQNGLAILEGGAADTQLTLNPGSNIQGAIDLGGGLNILNVGNGLNIANTFVEGSRPFGLPDAIAPVIGTTNGAPYAINGNQIAVVDPTGQAMQDEIIIDLTNGISNSVFTALNAARHGAGPGPSGQEQPLFLTGPANSAAPSPETATRLWAKVFGSHRDQKAQSPTVDATHRLGGIISGIDAPVAYNIRAGGFLGGSTGKVDVDFNSQETKIDSFFGGVYAGTQMGAITLDATVTGGWTQHDRTRNVANNLAQGGIQTATADFDGYFIAPELAISVNSGFGLVPSARVRYVGYFLDGFAETGALGNFTVGNRDLQMLQGRFQIAMPIVTSGRDSSHTLIEPYIGIEGRTMLSGKNIDAVLLDQNINFSPGGDQQVVSVFAGLNTSARIASNLYIYANLEANFESDDSRSVAAHAGFKFTF